MRAINKYFHGRAWKKLEGNRDVLHNKKIFIYSTNIVDYLLQSGTKYNLISKLKEITLWKEAGN